MDKLVDMELSKKEKKGHPASIEQTTTEGPDYPWGLAITLEDESLKKMKVKLSDYQIGAEVILHAECKVIRLSQSEREGDGRNRTMELQITSMGLEASGESDEDEDDMDWGTDSRKVDKQLKKKGYD